MAEPSKNDQMDDENHVGVHVDIILNGFNGDQPIRAKIDTGADASSLHGANIDVTSDEVGQTSTVRFTYGDYQYNMPVVAFQAVSSADGGTANRPVVSIPVRINGNYIDDAMFNLNDRGNMDYPVLIGLDLIKAAKLTIDPSISEMEVSFGPNGFEKTDGTSNVDNNKEIGDNDDTVESENDPFIEWYRANKNRTLQDVFSELVTQSNKGMKEDAE